MTKNEAKINRQKIKEKNINRDMNKQFLNAKNKQRQVTANVVLGLRVLYRCEQLQFKFKMKSGFFIGKFLFDFDLGLFSFFKYKSSM